MKKIILLLLMLSGFLYIGINILPVHLKDIQDKQTSFSHIQNEKNKAAFISDLSATPWGEQLKCEKLQDSIRAIERDIILRKFIYIHELNVCYIDALMNIHMTLPK